MRCEACASERAKHGAAAAYAGRSRAERESEQWRSARYALRSLRERKSKLNQIPDNEKSCSLLLQLLDRIYYKTLLRVDGLALYPTKGGLSAYEI